MHDHTAHSDHQPSAEAHLPHEAERELLRDGMEQHRAPDATGMTGHHDMHPPDRGAPVQPGGMGEHAAMDRGAHIDHTGHELMFRQRFWVCLVLSIPVLVLSPTIQEWLGFTPPAFPGSEWGVPVLSVIIFLYGGVPFLQMAVPELQNRQPGMMTLISLAIGVAFLYNLATLFLALGMGFFWELVTLIDVMLLGHWIEMRSVRQASSALQALSQLMPDTAERVRPDGTTETVRVTELNAGDLLLVRPGASIPADGRIEQGQSDVNEALITGDSEAVARAVAGELGIDQYFAQVLPENKDAKVTELQAQGNRVAMVGDRL